MKLIIDIDEEIFNKLPEAELGSNVIEDVLEAVENGIPLKDKVMIATLMSLVTDKDYKPNVMIGEVEKGEEK